MSNEEGGKGNGTVLGVKSTGSSCMKLIGADKSFNKLFKRPKLFGFRVKVLEANNLLMSKSW